MAKKSSVNKNTHRRDESRKYASRRRKLKAIVMDRLAPAEERFAATLKLATLPRNGASTRIRNRCAISGRPRGYYRKFNMSRIAFRDLASRGLVPGVTKASW
jgi:small subunit ribosomal protein S14